MIEPRVGRTFKRATERAARTVTDERQRQDNAGTTVTIEPGVRGDRVTESSERVRAREVFLGNGSVAQGSGALGVSSEPSS